MTTVGKQTGASSLLHRLALGAQGFATMALWVCLAFVGAGRLDWRRGWVSTAVYGTVMLLAAVFIHRFNPGMLQVRSQWRRRQMPRFDKICLLLYLPLTFVQVLVAGMDSVRYRWLPLPAWTMVPGIVLFVLTMAQVTWVIATNPYADAVVRIQPERGHRVISTGPYRIVRHPMYAGTILMYPATALMLGSGCAIGVAGAILVVIIWRTAEEDRFLQRELPGYAEFAARTRYRLIPRVW